MDPRILDIWTFTFYALWIASAAALIVTALRASRRVRRVRANGRHHADRY